LFHIATLPSAEFFRMLDRATTRREPGTKVGQLSQSGYQVFSVWRAGGLGANLEEIKVWLLYPEFPDTFWSFNHALKFIQKRAALPPPRSFSPSRHPLHLRLPLSQDLPGAGAVTCDAAMKVNAACNVCSGYT